MTENDIQCIIEFKKWFQDGMIPFLLKKKNHKYLQTYAYA